MKKINRLIFLFIFTLLLIPTVNAKEITINLFYSKTCPHCASELEFLNNYKEENSNVKLNLYEVTENEDNSKLLDLVKESLDCTHNYVPYTVIGEIGLTGFSDNIESQIKHFVDKYQNEDYIDLVSEVENKGTSIKINEIDGDETKETDNEKIDNETVSVPLLGEVDSKNVSLPLIAAIIGFVDGFNPCAMWILIFLISMLLGSKNKKRMIPLGIIFLVSSAFVYLLFMMAWLKIMISTMQINIIKIIIGIVALIGAIWNFKCYYDDKKKDVGCEVVNKNKRKRLIDKIKKIVSEKSFIIAAIGMIILAFSVNLIEFACSAGWPVIFTEILAINNLNKLSYFIYILIYILFYMLDDIIIFIIAMVTLEVTGISNKYNKYSHLIGGSMMLIIGLLMLFKPEWLMFNF